MTGALRIANSSGFFGDRYSAVREMIDGGEIDVLTGDYLAELTMFILSKSRSAGRPGYASTFLRQMEDTLVDIVARRIKVVTNAGGLDPSGLAEAIEQLSQRLGIAPKIAYVTGDDLIPQLGRLRADGEPFQNIDTGEVLDDSALEPYTANVYLGARGIARALAEGADIVICPRVTDASLVVGPCIWKFGWSETDYNQLAGAVAVGHVIECGAQATGGNYAFADEIDTSSDPGFPLAEMSHDGSAVITKHPGTGGAVTVGTVTAQLLYEVGEREYLNPDVTLHLDSIQLTQQGADRVLVTGAVGTPPPPTSKVAMTMLGPYRQNVVVGIPGLDIEDKARRFQRGIVDALGGVDEFDDVSFRLVRSEQLGAEENELAVSQLHVSFCSSDRALLGRRIFDAATGLALSSFPGIFFPGERQQKPTQTGVNWPCLISSNLVRETVTVLGDSRITIEPRMTVDRIAAERSNRTRLANPFVHGPETVLLPLGHLFGARSGDKGAHANVGIWARDDQSHAWLEDALDVELFRRLLPEAGDLEIVRVPLPNLRGVNFLVKGLLGAGAAAAGRFDPQAKSLAEFVRGRTVEVPAALVKVAEPVEARFS